MDESKAIHHLRMSFPNKPEEYLHQMYEKYDCDLNEAMYQIAKSKSKKSNIFVRFLTGVINLFCGCNFGEDSDDEYYFKAENLRDRAKECHKNRQMLENKAKEASKSNDVPLSNYYSAHAKWENQVLEQANSMAVMAFLEENQKRNSSKGLIDLHYLYVKEALQALDIFLDKEISLLRNGGRKDAALRVVTGRGKHSIDGIPRVKIAVKDRLQDRGLNCSELNPGLLEVFISNRSLLTNDLKRALHDKK